MYSERYSLRGRQAHGRRRARRRASLRRLARPTFAASDKAEHTAAHGALRFIGATTLDGYRQYIEKDAALERRFQQAAVAGGGGDRPLGHTARQYLHRARRTEH